MRHIVIALTLTAVVASPVHADEIDQIENNLETSCSNYFRKLPNRVSSDSKKFCGCFGGTFASMISLRELDAANGVVTLEIQEQFERAADFCGRDLAPEVARAARAWIGDTDQ